ncbi:MAG: FeoA family protein [Synergistes sp.]|nr:FeoA family protein [Synergistes sp.]
MKLTELNDGERAIIVALPDGEAAQRLEAVGLHVGKEIEKISCMPFGGPVTVLLDGRHFAVSHGVAREIEMKSRACNK